MGGNDGKLVFTNRHRKGDKPALSTARHVTDNQLTHGTQSLNAAKQPREAMRSHTEPVATLVRGSRDL